MDYVENGGERKEQLRRWIEAWLKRAPVSLEAASADASFRRYFRVDCGDRTLIAMDAPPTHEDCRPFVKVARLMAEAGLNVPQVIAEDLENGFLLLSDLGNSGYLQALNAESAPRLFADATDALIREACRIAREYSSGDTRPSRSAWGSSLGSTESTPSSSRLLLADPLSAAR